MWRHIASNAFTFLIVGLFLAAGVVAWGAREYRAEGPLEAAICLEVPSGGTFKRVSADLVEKETPCSPFYRCIQVPPAPEGRCSHDHDHHPFGHRQPRKLDVA